MSDRLVSPIEQNINELQEMNYYRGRADERKAIVTWLRKQKLPYCRQFADQIEQRVHRE